MKKSSKGFVSPYKDSNTTSTPSINHLASKPKKITTSTTSTTSTTTTSSSSSPIETQKTKSKANSSSNNNDKSEDKTNDGELIHYKIGWCAKSTKKHKIYNDGYLMYDQDKKIFTLYDDCGKENGKSVTVNIQDVKPDTKVFISSKEVLIEHIITSKEFEKATGLESSLVSNSTSSSSLSTTTIRKLSKKQQKLQEEEEEKQQQQQDEKQTTNINKSTIKKEFKSHTSLEEQKSSKKIVCPHDPNSKDALIFYSPPPSQLDEEGNKVVHVVLDPYIGRHLRPHQRRGVKFLYDCVTGNSNDNGYSGAILADQMGLGKTLQTLALLWTLLKQSPYGKPTIKKAIIVTPSTLVNNWKSEIQKWFGNGRLIASTLTDSLTKETKANLNDFNTSIKPVLIISYEQCRIFSKELETMSCGLMVCDEAHRLKNSNAKTTQSIMSVRCDRKILLTGTPIQNNLVEFYSMMDFANPNCLGSLADFKKSFIIPINKSRESPNSTSTSEGIRKSIQLSKLVKPFIIRRKSNILEKYLPPKRVQIIFCKLSSLQIELYKSILNSNSVKSLLSGGGSRGSATSLSTITLLKKLCNSPSLLLLNNKQDEGGEQQQTEIQNILKKHNYTLENYQEIQEQQDNESGKLLFVESLIKQLKPMNEKLVLVSNFTKTLDVFERLCKRLSIDTLRLDGDVKADSRQALVDKFNSSTQNVSSSKSSSSQYQVFLLSAKAGGVGINLIGGNHLVLYDPDWNPAIDIQAMERIWREGQTKPVFIYRLFSTGTIEEKIYQRQLMKESISNSIVDKKFNDNGGNFSLEDLKDIFSYNENTNSDTHDLLQCNCGNSNSNASTSINIKRIEIFKTIQHLDKWEHYRDVDQFSKQCNHDSILKKLKSKQDPISFIFISKTPIPSNNDLDDDQNDDDDFSFLEVENQIEDEEEDNNQQNTTPSKKRSNKKKEVDEEEEQEEEGEEEEETNPQTNLRKRAKINIVEDNDDDDLSDLDMS
ncbi:SNF2-related domain-containing protein [Dictyostelium discoideum AX4]|uniref:SNF2-related domain-containing protein n=1 Tax=Dictyostelium discoideum TaxID=44689 RepID=Q54NP1_DICDI|nr:SNF2-related domain-containing protein [Dictyostelium discoideum AX4]EAL64871.1 SNF2-related domain-containing protein [Dictyostelium discoideum AX4]|eukprot:XP_639875.1 SNF2-related domain-containing protein [Dictyostelium discoideum AX4]